VINERYERGALIITSNRAFREWPDLFQSPLLASAALDRLAHHAHQIVQRLRATPEQLSDALGAATALHPVYRRVLHMMLTELRLIDEQISELDQEITTLLGTARIHR